MLELSNVAGVGAETDGGLQRLRATETRLRSEIAAAQALNLQRHSELQAAGGQEYRRLLQLREQSKKRERKREEQEVKASRLASKLATLQVCTPIASLAQL
jgi:hypothetical protein